MALWASSNWGWTPLSVSGFGDNDILSDVLVLTTALIGFETKDFDDN